MRRCASAPAKALKLPPAPSTASANAKAFAIARALLQQARDERRDAGPRVVGDPAERATAHHSLERDQRHVTPRQDHQRGAVAEHDALVRG